MDDNVNGRYKKDDCHMIILLFMLIRDNRHIL